MTRSKAAWLSEHLACTVCHTSPLVSGETGWRCPVCEADFPLQDHCPNFITDRMAFDFNIKENAKASDHAYNPSAVRLLAEVERVGGMALDCGAGSRQYTSEHLVQVEIMPYDSVDVLAVNQALPFRDASFDVVFSFDVLEHVSDPFASARELARVLKPNGMLYIDLPFLQVEHGYPHHYFNATRMGLRQLFEGLLTPRAHVVPASGHPAHVVYQALSAYRGGLAPELRERFLAMTVGEILDRSWKALRDSDLGAVKDEVQWRMASATQAIFTKDTEAPEGTSSEIDVDWRTLPNFVGKRSFTP